MASAETLPSTHSNSIGSAYSDGKEAITATETDKVDDVIVAKDNNDSRTQVSVLANITLKVHCQ